MSEGEQDFSQRGQVDNPEDKEKEKSMPIFMVYRDNDLFKEWIPKVQKILESFDHKVKVHAFSAETEEKEIIHWLQDNKFSYDNKDIMTDGTVRNCMHEIKKNDPNRSKDFQGIKSHLGYLDGNLFSPIMRDVIFNKEKEISSEVRGIEFDKKIFIGMIKEIIKNQASLPNKVYIISTIFGSHLGRIPGGSTDEYLKEFGVDNINNDKFHVKAAEMYTDCFPQGGIPKDKITIEKYMEEYMDQDKNWIIYDRHYSGSRYQKNCGPIKHAIQLRFPVDNFFADAVRNGLIRINLEEPIKNNLEKEFSKK